MLLAEAQSQQLLQTVLSGRELRFVHNWHTMDEAQEEEGLRGGAVIAPRVGLFYR